MDLLLQYNLLLVCNCTTNLDYVFSLIHYMLMGFALEDQNVLIYSAASVVLLLNNEQMGRTSFLAIIFSIRQV